MDYQDDVICKVLVAEEFTMQLHLFSQNHLIKKKKNLKNGNKSKIRIFILNVYKIENIMPVSFLMGFNKEFLDVFVLDIMYPTDFILQGNREILYLERIVNHQVIFFLIFGGVPFKNEGKRISEAFWKLIINTLSEVSSKYLYCIVHADMFFFCFYF